MKMSDGTTQPLSNLSVRATEYTVRENGPLTMPAELPTMSAYTYCVELSVDEAIQVGASTVIFSKPVKIYVENFIGFPIGSVVPVGYYDRNEAKWIASKNGVVIKIINEIDGKVQLDVDGDNIVESNDSLLTWGFDDIELRTLATEYDPGISLWRVQTEHFSPYDCNWATVSTMPSDGTPNLEDPKGDQKLDDDCKESENSIIGIQNQTLGESNYISGTQYGIQYESDRVLGRTDNYSIEIKLSNDTIPQNLHHIKLMVSIAGRKFVKYFSPLPNQKYRFDWDGKDAYGRLLYGKQKAMLEVGYFYPECYTAPAWAGYLRDYYFFGIIPPTFVSYICSTVEMASAYQSWTELIGQEGGYVMSQDIAGWSVDVHHSYDVNARELYLGDGSTRTSSIVNNQIKTFAGTGDYIFAGDNGEATLASFEYLNSIVKGKDGSIYIAENNRVRKIDKDGIITTVAGNGDYGVSGDSGLAINAATGNISDIALSPAGDLYIAQVYEGVIRKVDRNGYITTIAGSGNYGEKGDYGDALLASLSPTKLTVDKDNSVFVLDQLHNCIRRIGTNNIITTFAGNGEYDFSGDGGQATEAALGLYMCFWHGPCINGDISVGPDGSLYIADMSNQRIRKVRNDGIINTIAGSGIFTDPNSGVQALDAYISAPTAIEVGDDGTIYFSDSNSRLNKISTKGILTNIAGPCDDPFLLSPCPVSYEEGGIAGSSFVMPLNITIGEDNTLYFADGSNKVLNIYPTLPSFNNNQIFLPSESGAEIFVFNEEGTHLKTLDRLTNKVLFEFEYNNKGKLVAIKDMDGLQTSIQRDSSANPVSITSPFGQQTLLTTNSNGYLETVTNPANELTSFSYTDDGLLTNVTKPKGNSSTFTYDLRGRLIKDENSGGGFIELNRTELTNGYRVTKNTAEGRTTTYQVEFLPSGELKTTNTSEGNLTSSSIQNPDGTTTITKVDGMKSISVLGPDPEFGMEAPLTKSLSVKSPSGLTSIFSQSKTITQYTGDKVTGIVDSFITNNRVTRSIYDGNQNLFTSISPMGKQAFTYTDTLGRVVQSSIPGINPVNYTYNNLGFLTAINQNGRQTSFSYNPKGYLETTTDPLGRVETMYYDSVGRVTTQVLPNNQQIFI
jgi:YD repeat-containing protein